MKNSLNSGFGPVGGAMSGKSRFYIKGDISFSSLKKLQEKNFSKGSAFSLSCINTVFPTRKCLLWQWEGLGGKHATADLYSDSEIKKKRTTFWFAPETFVCFFDLCLISKLDKLQAGEGRALRMTSKHWQNCGFVGAIVNASRAERNRKDGLWFTYKSRSPLVPSRVVPVMAQKKRKQRKNKDRQWFETCRAFQVEIISAYSRFMNLFLVLKAIEGN